MKEERMENEFERLLKEKANRFEMKPSPEVWHEVQSAIQQNRRRRFAWWWMAAGLLLVMGTGTFFILQNKSHQSATISASKNNANENNSAASNSSAEKNSKEKNSATTGTNTTPPLQNQTGDHSPSKNDEENISNGRKENDPIASSGTRNSYSNSSKKRTAIVQPGQIQKQVPEEISLKAEADESDNNIRGEFIASLSLKRLTISSSENSINALPFQITYFDFSSASSNHSFYFEADAMPLASFVWNHTTVSKDSLTLYTNSNLPMVNSSYSSAKGFSAGGNFIFEQNKKCLIGAGLHFTKTHLEAITSQQSLPVYDTSYVFDGTAFQPEVIYTGDTTVYQSQGDINQWLDASLFAGVKLFPSSKNHLRILAGGGYSKLLVDHNSNEITPVEFSDYFSSGSGGGNTTASINPTPVFSYHKNQIQLFSEISYQHDFAGRISFSVGGQLHYYPMNLLKSEQLSQHLMWVGLKGGLMIRL